MASYPTPRSCGKIMAIPPTTAPPSTAVSPFGFTFWREDPSFFTGLCVLFLIGVLGVSSFREKRYYGVAAAGVLFGFWAYMTLVLDADESIGWILFGGLLGELVLSTVAIVSFYYRAPDRLRWDFWRATIRLMVLPSGSPERPPANTFSNSWTSLTDSRSSRERSPARITSERLL